MKRLITIFALMLLLIGCSSNNDTADTGETDNGTDAEETTEAAESSGEKITIKLVHDAPEDHPQGIGTERIKELAEERLGDRVEVEVFPNASLFDIDEGLEALQSGTIQMLSGPTAALVGMDPAYQLYNLPFLFQSNDELRAFDESEQGMELRSKIESNNLKIVGYWFGNFKQITNSKNAINTPEDLKGLKMRIMAGGLLEDQYTRLGASAVVLPYSELYMALQQGTIDGQENSFTEIAQSNLFEVQDYLTVTNHAPGSYPLITNKEFWDGLDEEIKTELEAIIAEVTDEVASLVAELEARDLEILEETDIEITHLTDEEINAFKEVLEPLYEEYKDEIGAEIVDAALGLN